MVGYLKSIFVAVLAVLLMLSVLSGCIQNQPTHEDDRSSSALSTQGTPPIATRTDGEPSTSAPITDTAETVETTTPVVTDSVPQTDASGFPNRAEDDATKRY